MKGCIASLMLVCAGCSANNGTLDGTRGQCASGGALNQCPEAEQTTEGAPPTLIKLADTETFDIIGEIAIEGLGTLGDPQAVGVLQKIANDPARDKSQRELARKALAKLGANADAPPPPNPPPDRRPPP